MSQQHPPYPPPRAYSPLQRTESPQGNPYPLDPKRQPFSPTSQSAYNSAGPSNIALPNQVFSSPYYGSQPNGSHPGSPYSATSPYARHPAYNTMNGLPAHPQHPPPASGALTPSSHNIQTAQSQQATSPQNHMPSGAMGPPSRPTDKPTDINDLGDVLSGSGIDLREEEAAMYRSYPERQYGQYQSQEPVQTVQRPYPFPQDNFYSQQAPGDRQMFYGAGTFNQSPGPYKSAEEVAEIEKRRAIRRRDEIKQYHLSQPFLLTGNLRRRFDAERNRNHVRFDESGLLTPRPNGPPRECRIVGPDGNEVIKILQNEEILQKDTALSEVLTLISLAAEERLRVLIEDAAVLAKERRIGSLGILPSELVDVPEEKEQSSGVNGLPTPSNSAVSPKPNPLKRSYSEVNKPLTPVSEKSNTLDSFLPPLNKVAQALQDSVKKERLLEEERLAKRQKRQAAAAGEPMSLDVGSSSGTTGTLGEVAPDVDPKRAGTKKVKGQVDNATQAQQLAALNKTTQMALGGKQLPSWMKKGPDTGPSNPYLARSNTNVQKSGGAAADSASQVPKPRSFGGFREDRDGGKSIQLRDLLLVLEDNAFEKKSLQKAYTKLVA